MEAMMKIEILTVGKLKEKFDTQALLEQQKRLSAFCEVTITELKEVQVMDGHASSIQSALAEEALSIKKRIPEKACVIVLDIEGKAMKSETFAMVFQQFQLQHHQFIFIIGSAWGLDTSIKQMAHLRWSFSPLTFPHTMMRLMLLEQIYRAFKINHHQPYHK
jgi:23S rRNA (pseudouridine1915-N3)-methyltransferase